MPKEGAPPTRPATRRRVTIPLARASIGASLLLGSLAAQWLARSSPELVERLFAKGLYPRLGAMLGRAASVAPVSLAELLVPAAVLALLCVMARSVRRIARGTDRVLPFLGRSAANALLAVGLGYGLFLLLWGFNYARLPYAAIAGLEAGPAATSELRDLAADLVLASNEAREGLAEDDRGALRIDGGFASVAGRATAGYAAVATRWPFLSGPAARPKPALVSPFLARLGITGLYFPFTGEPHVNTTLPDAELPFSTAHELAHHRGFAREDEANYVGYLACRHHRDADFRYSGLLAASHYALAALHAVDPDAARVVGAQRSAAVLRDEAAIRAWADRYRGRAAELGHRVNDAYLRAQGQKEGIRSYGRMVDLLLAERRPRAATPPVPH